MEAVWVITKAAGQNSYMILIVFFPMENEEKRPAKRLLDLWLAMMIQQKDGKNAKKTWQFCLTVTFFYRVVKGGVPRGGGSLIFPNVP